MAHAARTVWLAAVVVTAGIAVSAAQEKGGRSSSKEQLWRVEFATSEDLYSGTMTLTVEKGVVSGKMLLDSPMKIEGTVDGKQSGETFTFDYPFTIYEQNCTGRLQVEAKLAAQGEEASGRFQATGCSEAPVEGTITMKKGAAAAK